MLLNYCGTMWYLLDPRKPGPMSPRLVKTCGSERILGRPGATQSLSRHSMLSSIHELIRTRNRLESVGPGNIGRGEI